MLWHLPQLLRSWEEEGEGEPWGRDRVYFQKGMMRPGQEIQLQLQPGLSGYVSLPANIHGIRPVTSHYIDKSNGSRKGYMLELVQDAICVHTHETLHVVKTLPLCVSKQEKSIN